MNLREHAKRLKNLRGENDFLDSRFNLDICDLFNLAIIVSQPEKTPYIKTTPPSNIPLNPRVN